MKNFALDDKGDVLIKDNVIQMVDDTELICQTCQTVLGTNVKEWFLNENEGIKFRNILIKNPDFDVIRNEVKRGLLQVDSTFALDSFEYQVKNRRLYISFSATNGVGTTVKGGQSYGG